MTEQLNALAQGMVYLMLAIGAVYVVSKRQYPDNAEYMIALPLVIVAFVVAILFYFRAVA